MRRLSRLQSLPKWESKESTSSLPVNANRENSKRLYVSIDNLQKWENVFLPYTNSTHQYFFPNDVVKLNSHRYPFCECIVLRGIAPHTYRSEIGLGSPCWHHYRNVVVTQGTPLSPVSRKCPISNTALIAFAKCYV